MSEIIQNISDIFSIISLVFSIICGKFFTRTKKIFFSERAFFLTGGSVAVFLRAVYAKLQRRHIVTYVPATIFRQNRFSGSVCDYSASIPNSAPVAKSVPSHALSAVKRRYRAFTGFANVTRFSWALSSNEPSQMVLLQVLPSLLTCIL